MNGWQLKDIKIICSDKGMLVGMLLYKDSSVIFAASLQFFFSLFLKKEYFRTFNKIERKILTK
jgi:hypothetical protein